MPSSECFWVLPTFASIVIVTASRAWYLLVTRETLIGLVTVAARTMKWSHFTSKTLRLLGRSVNRATQMTLRAIAPLAVGLLQKKNSKGQRILGGGAKLKKKSYIIHFGALSLSMQRMCLMLHSWFVQPIILGSYSVPSRRWISDRSIRRILFVPPPKISRKNVAAENAAEFEKVGQ